MWKYTNEIRISFFSLVMSLFLLSAVQSSFSQIDGESFKELSEEDLRLIEEYLDQAKTLFEQRFTESTIFHYDEVLEIDSLNIDALNGKAMVLDFVGNPEEAISYYDKVLKIDSKNIDAILGKALALDKLGKHEEANSYFEKALETEEIQERFQDISDEDLELLDEFFEQAQDLLEEENYEEAILFYDGVLAIESTDIDALFGKAFALDNIGKHEEAISFYDKVLEIDSTDIDALNGKALALDNIGKHEEAISFYDIVLEIDPTDIDALFGKALSLESLGREEEAILNLEKIETLIPPEVELRVPPEGTVNQAGVEDIAEVDQTLFVIVGVVIVILISIILIYLIVRRAKSLRTAKTS